MSKKKIIMTIIKNIFKSYQKSVDELFGKKPINSNKNIKHKKKKKKK